MGGIGEEKKEQKKTFFELFPEQVINVVSTLLRPQGSCYRNDMLVLPRRERQLQSVSVQIRPLAAVAPGMGV